MPRAPAPKKVFKLAAEDVWFLNVGDPVEHRAHFKLVPHS